MKIFIVFAVTLCLAAFFMGQSVASPVEAAEENQFIDGLDALKSLEPELHGRYKRATCDLFSGFGIKHSACAAHCLLRGNRGGYCTSRGICECRN